MSETSLRVEPELGLSPASENPRSSWLQAGPRRRRLENRALLAAVLVVVMLVTLPRLHGIALRENELDALRVLDLLAPRVLAAPALSAEGAQLKPTALGSFLLANQDIERRLADIEILDEGRLILRHGYLFELVELAGLPCLRAWPMEHGRTGLGAFVSLPLDPETQGRPALLVHANDHADQARRWSGPDHAPAPDLAEQSMWRRVRVPETLTESY